MKRMKHYCIWSVVVFGAAGAAVFAASLNPAHVATTVAAVATVNPVESVCVLGWSKDHCNGEVQSNNVRAEACVTVTPDGDVVDCRTIYVRDARWKIPVRASLDSCGTTADVPCDEIRELDGTLVITGDLTFRGQESCPYRGCWSGEWQLFVDNQAAPIAAGRAGGPLGTGSHRTPTCPSNTPCGPDCERCYEVQFTAITPTQGRWDVDVEGCIDGKTLDNGPYPGATICVAFSGVISTTGNAFGPFNFGAWRLCGTSDGTVLAPCHAE
jgi:hypothetical protein